MKRYLEFDTKICFRKKRKYIKKNDLVHHKSFTKGLSFENSLNSKKTFQRVENTYIYCICQNTVIFFVRNICLNIIQNFSTIQNLTHKK